RPASRPQTRRAPVLQEEDALAETPERRGSELVASGLALEDVVGQARPHIVDQQVGEEVHRLGVERRDRRGAGLERWRMAERASDGPEEVAAPADRVG